MKRLNREKRMMMFGGAAKARGRSSGSRSNSSKKPGRPPSKLTKWNNAMFTAGEIAMATVSSIEHLNFSIPKLISAISGDEETYLKHKNRETKNFRPTFRFSRDYWNSSVTYGLPGWYY